MKEKSKKILKIIAFILAGLAGLFVVLTIINLIFPSVNYFGYRFIVKNYNTDQIAVTTDFSYTNYNLNVSTSKYSIEIVTDNQLDDGISYSYTGFHLGISDAENVKVLQALNENTINLTVLEPLGLVTSINCKITIKLSSECVYNISVFTQSGNTVISDANINHLNLISSTGDFTLSHQQKEASLQSLNVITNSGKVDFSELDEVVINRKSFVYADDTRLLLNNLYGSLVIHANKIDISAKHIDASAHGFELVCSKGSFKAQSLNSGDKDFTIVSDACNININDITGRSSITTTSGHINVSNLNLQDCIIRTTSGNVNINIATDNIFVITTSGNINVKEYYKTGQFATNSGDINVKSLSAFDVNYSTSISTNSGNVNFENNVNKSIVSIGGGEASIKMWNVAQAGNIEHRINNVNGKTSIAIMARISDIIRFSLMGDVSGNVRELELYADDSFIIRPTGASYTDQATFICTGGQLVFSQLDPQ